MFLSDRQRREIARVVRLYDGDYGEMEREARKRAALGIPPMTAEEVQKLLAEKRGSETQAATNAGTARP